MPKNNRIPTTITRSISWRFDVLAAIDQRVEELGSERSPYADRSALLNAIAEHVLGIVARPEVVGHGMPFKRDTERAWEARIDALAREAGAPAKPKHGVLVKRPSVGIGKKK